MLVIWNEMNVYLPFLQVRIQVHWNASSHISHVALL